MFSLEKRGFGDDSGDSLDDSPGSKAAHKTTQHLQAWTCMDRQESQSNWQEMRKTLGKPGFLAERTGLELFDVFPVFLESSKAFIDYTKTRQFVHSEDSRILRDGQMEEIRVEQSEIEIEYERRWKAMSPAEKVARSSAMLAWTRQQMAIRIRNTQPSLSDEEVRLHVALQLYERDPEVVRLIQEQLAHVSG